MSGSRAAEEAARDAIIRKIAALLARAEDKASSAAEVAHAIATADKLMRRYNLTRDEVRIRQEEFRRARFRFDTQDEAYAGPIATAISRLAQCHIRGAKRDGVFLQFTGLRVDVDYAYWLLRAIWSAKRQGWTAYQGSPQHRAYVDAGVKRATIEHQFKLGFTHEIVDRIRTLAVRNNESSRELIELKNALIEQAFGRPNSEITSQTREKADLADVYRSGAEASKSVPLQHELGDKPAAIRLPR